MPSVLGVASTFRFLNRSNSAACPILHPTASSGFSQRRLPVGRVIERINPILRGWVNYFAVGHAGRCFTFIKDWVEKKIRRHLMRARKRKGFGWKQWSRAWHYNELGLFNDYRVRRGGSLPKVEPAR